MKEIKLQKVELHSSPPNPIPFPRFLEGTEGVMQVHW